MASPTSPPRLHGASCVTGGFSCGHAQGNVLNHADVDEIIQHTMQSQMGKVQVYVSHVDPTATKPKWSLKHQVVPKLKPVLKTLARQYSPICSKFLICLIIILFYFV